MVDRVEKTDEQWRDELTPDQFYVCREAGTERPFTGKYNDFKGVGTFLCSCCGNPLFRSDTKFNSGTGWPSFYQPISTDAVHYTKDYAFLMERVEVTCAACDSHLGHVFNDGPQPTGKRYCMNSVSLEFVSEEKERNPAE